MRALHCSTIDAVPIDHYMIVIGFLPGVSIDILILLIHLFQSEKRSAKACTLPRMTCTSEDVA
jgi:hypothetical protein